MRLITFLFLFSALLIAGCNKQDKDTKTDTTQTQNNVHKTVHVGEIVENMDAGDYTYVKLNEDNSEYWIAIPKTSVKKGEKLTFSDYMEMKDFESKSLGRTFKSVLFVQDARKVADEKTLKSAHSNVVGKEYKDIKVTPLKDGKTIAQIYENKASLAGKTIKVRGKVVKYNGGIMNRNWIHIQDGTESNGNFDLLITSDESANVGDIVVAEGTLTTDKDFGAGYFYPVVIENGKIRVEKMN